MIFGLAWSSSSFLRRFTIWLSMVLQKIFAQDDFAAVLPEVLENLEFTGRHLEGLSVLGRLVFFEVEMDAAEVDGILIGCGNACLGSRISAAQERLDAG